MQIEEILSRLEGVKPGSNENQYTARCPAHEDHRNSLSIGLGVDGKVLLHCHAGCETSDILDALDLSETDLFQKDDDYSQIPEPEPGKDIIYSYTDENGGSIARKTRIHGDKARTVWTCWDPDQQKWINGTTINGKKITVPLYNLEGIRQAKPEEPIYIVEGEKDADTLNNLGRCATTAPNGAGSNWSRVEGLNFLYGHSVIIIPNNDSPGRKYAQNAAEALQNDAQVKVIYLQRSWSGMPEKADITDFIKYRHPKAALASLDSMVKLSDDYGEPAKVSLYSDIERKPVKWLWKPYLPRGQVSMISAAPGAGKTWISLYIAACITANRNLPESTGDDTKGTGYVVYFTAEDDPASTIKPRFEDSGGNCEKLITTEELPTDFSDPIIKQIIDQYKPDLVVFDAVSSFIGNANMNRANEVRGAMKPLVEAVKGTDTAALVIAHNNKMSSETNAQNRVTGSVDFTALIRSGLVVGKNPDDPDLIVMAQFKNSLEKVGKSLAFRLQKNDCGNPYLEYEGLASLSADVLVGGHRGTDQPPRRAAPAKEEAKEVIQDILDCNGGWAKASEILEELKTGYGISAKTAHSARQEIGAEPVKRNIEGSKKVISYWHYPGVTVPDHPDIEQMGFKEITGNVDTTFPVKGNVVTTT